ncbi:MAG TPA: hypothetical protein VGJ01_15435 [Pseudolabrys sp.]|jgi:hypothetical protein
MDALNEMLKETPVYTFRISTLRRGADPTIISVAPRNVVQAIFGGGGPKGIAGLDKAFGGGTVFENHRSGGAFLGVWGRRNASRFCALIRQSGYMVKAISEPPPARQVLSAKTNTRPPRPTLESIVIVDPRHDEQ